MRARSGLSRSAAHLPLLQPQVARAGRQPSATSAAQRSLVMPRGLETGGSLALHPRRLPSAVSLGTISFLLNHPISADRAASFAPGLHGGRFLPGWTHNRKDPATVRTNVQLQGPLFLAHSPPSLSPSASPSVIHLKLVGGFPKPEQVSEVPRFDLGLSASSHAVHRGSSLAPEATKEESRPPGRGTPCEHSPARAGHRPAPKTSPEGQSSRPIGRQQKPAGHGPHVIPHPAGLLRGLHLGAGLGLKGGPRRSHP